MVTMFKILAGCFSLIQCFPNAKVQFTEPFKTMSIIEEKAFAEKIQSTFQGGKIPPLSTTASVEPFTVELTSSTGGASSDVGDVSWATPTAGVFTATFVPGSSGHSWQNVAAAGNTIGTK